MNFTREPIIESILTPKEGCKLAVRNSKGVGQEEYFVDALEIVSFGSAYFFRSIERSKSFLLPATDFEVIEIKEARMALKHVSLEKNVKIGGGRDAVFRSSKEEESSASSKEEKPAEEGKPEKKKEAKKRPKRRRSRGSRDKDQSGAGKKAAETESPEGSEAEKPEPVAEGAPKEEAEPSDEKQALRSMLLVPPDTLISESLGYSKHMLPEPPPIPALEEEPSQKEKKEDHGSKEPEQASEQDAEKGE